MPSWAELLAQHNSGSHHSKGKEVLTPSHVDPILETRKDELNSITLPESGFLSLVPGCIQNISKFLSYGDVLQLRSVCTQLHRFITADDVLWDSQLERFHTEMENLYGAMLLRTDFAFPFRKGFERFAMERRLYHFDSMRAWSLQEYTSLHDGETGIFTVPLYQKTLRATCSEWELCNKQEIGAPLLLRKMENQTIPIRLYSIERGRHQGKEPLDMNDEDAVLQYVLALSVAESGRNDSHPFEDIRRKFSQKQFTPSQILSVVDGFSSASPNNEMRFHVEDTTDTENHEFISALSLTVTAVKHRRLLVSNRRSRQNNGQNSSPHNSLRLSCGIGAIPPENKILSAFGGQLLEISKHEMLSLCRSQLRNEVIDALETFIGYEPSHSRAAGVESRSHVTQLERKDNVAGRVYPVGWIRCFLLPEVCKQSVIALLVVDPIRAFFLIQEIRSVTDTPEQEPDVIIAQRAVVYGRGLNPNTFQ